MRTSSQLLLNFLLNAAWQIAFIAALAIGGTADCIGFGAHQRLGEGLHHRAQKIGAGLRELLLQPARHVDTGSCGHRVAPSHRDLWTELNENHAMAASRHGATLTSANRATTSADATWS